MGNFDHAFIEELRVQSWSLYSVGILMICLRILARLRRLGLPNLQIDDYLMVLVGGLYTALVVGLNVIAQGGGSNLYPPEMAGTFGADEIRRRIHGSKVVVASEQAMLSLIYAIKACMLIMYMRLTLGLAAQTAVAYLAWYVAAGWAASELAFFTACRPFRGYWSMPPPDPQCTTLQNYAIVQGCFNISSDLLMLFVPVPLVLRVNMAWRQKAVLVCIFSMGLFVVVAALLTKVLHLTDVWDPAYMLWYCREASVAIYVSNLPMIWPLLREWFPCLRTAAAMAPTPSMLAAAKQQLGHGGSWARPRQQQQLQLHDHGSFLTAGSASMQWSKASCGNSCCDSTATLDSTFGQQQRPLRAVMTDSTEEVVRQKSAGAERGAAVPAEGATDGTHATAERAVMVRHEDAGLDLEKGIVFDGDGAANGDYDSDRALQMRSFSLFSLGRGTEGY